jgi:GH25 family lysozyme M1 (1,4-beta-N-acetylmuramidase)
MLIIAIVVGLALAVVAQAGARGSAALAAVTPVQGTDVSSLQGSSTSINWADVAGSERFVAVKATEGNYYTDPDYRGDVTAAAAAGLYVMPYVFANPYESNASNVNAGNGWGSVQANYAWKTISAATPAYGSSALMLPVAIDLEADPYVNQETNSNQCYGLSTSAMVAWIQSFIGVITADTKKAPVIYTTTSWWNACTGDSSAFKADPLWIASYGVSVPSIPSVWGNLTFWQYSESGAVAGIGGAVDLDSLGPTQASPINTAIPTEQIQTLSSLEAQDLPSGYTATGLPNGLSISTTGQVTGKPTALGQYAVTVTPPAGATPASMSFTWDVHGAITIANTSRSSTAGTPVWFRLATSGPDQTAGYAPTSWSASGLPTGASMNSAGVITGWPSRTGTFKVTVSATDALGGTGTTTFTWTVLAAPNAGTAGTVKQVGGSARCLDDPSGNTANGTVIQVWSCTGKSNQSWTVVQDGTLRTGGKCLQTVGNGTASGTKLELEPCNVNDGLQMWQAATDGQLVNPQSNKCLAASSAAAASVANGTKPVIEPCANSTSQPNEHWLRPAAPLASDQPGKCVGTSGTEAVLATCSTSGWQHWQPQTDGTIRINGWCLAENGATAGSTISLASCSGAGARTWKLVSAGPIATELVNTASGLCAGDPASGTQLVIAACANTATTTWHLE